MYYTCIKGVNSIMSLIFYPNLISSMSPFNCRHFMEFLQNFYGNSVTLWPNFFNWEVGGVSVL